MAIVYEKAPKDVLELVKEALLWHPALTACEVTVDVLMASKYERGPDGEQGQAIHALYHQGYAAAATIKKTTLQQRVLGQADALLTIDALGWDELDREEQLALLDHELTHLQVAAEDGGVCQVVDGALRGTPRSDDHGRPVLKLRLHDWQLGGFREVAQRHGRRALEVQAVRACVDEHGQYYWDWDSAEAGRVSKGGLKLLKA